MKKIKIVLPILIVAIIIGFIVIYFLQLPMNDNGKYYDDEEFIVAETTRYSFYQKLGNNDDLQFEKFSGTYLLTTFEDAEQVTISLSMNVTKGKCKVVLIDPQNTITILQEGDFKLDTIDGLYRIKLVGDNSSGDIQLDVTPS